VLDAPMGVDTETATLDWMANALQHARSQGQSKTVGYLEAVAEDMAFEMEMVTRRGVKASRDPS
jgi:anti-sigma regulatory factor (Ser/Thr protein kinase)